MLAISIEEASSTLEALVEAVESGREQGFVLHRDGKPAVVLAPLDPTDHRPILGLAKGQFTMPSEQEWAAMDKEVEQMFLGRDSDLPNAAE